MLCVGICCNRYRKEAVEVKDNSSYRGTYVWHKKFFILSKITVVKMRLLSKNKINQLMMSKLCIIYQEQVIFFIKHLIDFPTVKINFSFYKRWGMIKFLIIYFMYYYLEKLQKHPNKCSILKKQKDFI